MGSKANTRVNSSRQKIIPQYMTNLPRAHKITIIFLLLILLFGILVLNDHRLEAGGFNRGLKVL
jgi:hypothetical protein